MFRDWGFLLGEIWVLLLLAALLGLLAGWLIWSRREVNVQTGNADWEGRAGDLEQRLTHSQGEVESLRSQLSSLQAENVSAQGDLERCRAHCTELEAELAACRAAAADVTAAEPAAAVAEPEAVASAPLRLDGPRDGKADDLKRIKGIGPQMEALCNRLGFYHFDQIASWTDAETAWVDANLEGFQGRVKRDEWVDQAKLLAAGGETEFSKRVDRGDVGTSR